LVVIIPDKSNLPSELLELKQFILWFEKKVGDKLTKIPVAPWKTKHWQAASATDPENWTDFDTAAKYATQKDGYGIGFSFREDGGIVGIDLDNCVKEGKANKFSSEIILKANSFTELSPSMHGVHIFMCGNIADKVVKDDKIEIYSKNRYFTLTGKRCKDTPFFLNKNDGLLDDLFEKYWEKPKLAIVEKGADKSIPIASLLDVSGFIESGNHLRGEHPIHGSTTGSNFVINKEKNVWYCFRHGVGGGPLSLLGILKGIIKCEDCLPGRIRGKTFRKIMDAAKEKGLITDEKPKITDKYITDRIMSQYEFYCDKNDTNQLLYLWNGTVWHNGVAEGNILNELSEIFKEEEKRGGMLLDRTLNFIKGQAMNRTLKPKPQNIIAFTNGLYDVTEGKLHTHNPGLFYVNIIPHKFDEKADCLKWKKWLSEVVKEEDILFIQEWMGYLLYEAYPEPGFLILVGEGQNGKTIFMTMLQRILGDRNTTNVDLHEIVTGPYALSELYQKLGIVCDDISGKAVRESGRLKMISSGSWVEARQIYGKHFNFRTYAKPTFACNEPPAFREESDALKVRLKAVEFPYTFKKKPNLVNGEKLAQDRRELEAELEAEIPGIINWALDGLRRLIKNNFTFTESRSTEETWKFYMRKSNPVVCFVDERMVYTDDPEDVIMKEPLYQIFSKWLEESRVGVNVSRDKFFRGLKSLGIESTRSRAHDMQRVYISYKCSNVPTSSDCNLPQKTLDSSSNNSNSSNNGNKGIFLVGTLEQKRQFIRDLYNELEAKNLNPNKHYAQIVTFYGDHFNLIIDEAMAEVKTIITKDNIPIPIPPEANSNAPDYGPGEK